MNFLQDTDFLNYLSGKKVCIVGPASYLLDLDLGETIDSYDIVVRVNRGIEIMNLYPEKLGTKCDVLYNCGVKSPNNGGDLNTDFFKESGVKWICSIPKSNKDGKRCKNSPGKWFDRNFLTKAKQEFNFRFMLCDHYSEINSKAESRANTGFSAVFDILNHKPKELFVCGYSFYLDSFIKGYKKGCKMGEEEFSKKCFASRTHKQIPQWKYFKSMLETCPEIKTDPILNKILQMSDLSREEFEKIVHTN